MKQTIPLADLTPQQREHVTRWRKIKKYPQDHDLTIGELIELIIAISYNLHHEWSDGRFFRNILINEDSTLSWDDEELIDTLHYEFSKQFKQRLSQGTFTEEVII